MAAEDTRLFAGKTAISWARRLKSARAFLRRYAYQGRPCMKDLEVHAPVLVDASDRDQFRRVAGSEAHLTRAGPGTALAFGSLASSPPEAARWLSRARACVDTSQRELAARVAFELGARQLALGQAEAAEATLEWAAGLDTAGQLGDVAHLRGLIFDRRGHYAMARDAYRGAIAGWARTLTPMTTVLAHANLAVALHHRAPREAKSLACFALQMVEDFELADRYRPPIRNILGYALICCGELDKATEELEQAATEARHAADHRTARFTAFNRSIVAELRGDLSTADRLLADLGGDRSEEASALEPWVRIRLGWLAFRRGEPAPLERLLSHGVDGLVQPPYAPALTMVRALLATTRHAYGIARSGFREASDEAIQRGDDLTAFCALLWLGHAEHQGGRAGPATRAFEHAYRLGTAGGFIVSPNWWDGRIIESALASSPADRAPYFAGLWHERVSATEGATSSVRVTSDGEVWVDGRKLSAELWKEGHSGRGVLKRYLYFVASSGSEGRTRDAICDALWPASDGDAAVRNLYAATTDLRRVLMSVPRLRLVLQDGRYHLRDEWSRPIQYEPVSRTASV